MTTREQAEAAARSLVAAAEAERVRVAEQKTRPLVRMYPALARVPPLERHAALGDARGHAAAHPGSRLLLAAMALVLAAVVALGLTRHARLAVAAGCLLAALLILRQFVELALMRRYLTERFARDGQTGR